MAAKQNPLPGSLTSLQAVHEPNGSTEGSEAHAPAEKVVGPIVTVGELAEYLRMQPSRIYDLVRQGRLPYLKIGASLRFRLAEVDAWLDDECRPPH